MFKMTITTQAVSQTCSELKWSTLEQRRNQASLTMLHKIHNKQVNVDHSHLTTTRNNKFLIPHSKTKHHMNSFFPRAIRLWNELPTEIKDAPTVPAFGSGLNKFYAFIFNKTEAAVFSCRLCFLRAFPFISLISTCYKQTMNNKVYVIK